MKRDSAVFARRSDGGRRGIGAERGDTITSRDNKWLKLFRAALRGTGPRPGEAIGVEGPKFIEDALRSGLEADALLVSESGERHAAPVLRAASESEAGIERSRVLRTTDKLFESVAGTECAAGDRGAFSSAGVDAGRRAARLGSNARECGPGDCAGGGAGPGKCGNGAEVGGGVWGDGCNCYARDGGPVVAESTASFGGIGATVAADARHWRYRFCWLS